MFLHICLFVLLLYTNHHQDHSEGVEHVTLLYILKLTQTHVSQLNYDKPPLIFVLKLYI